MKTIFVKYKKTIWNLNKLQKSQIFQEILQIKWITSWIISKVIRLWLYTMVYTRKDKHKNRQIYVKIYKVSTKQSSISIKIRKTLFT